MQPDKQHKKHILLLNEFYLLIYAIISAQMMCYHLLQGGGGYKLTNVVTHLEKMAWTQSYPDKMLH